MLYRCQSKALGIFVEDVIHSNFTYHISLSVFFFELTCCMSTDYPLAFSQYRTKHILCNGKTYIKAISDSVVTHPNPFLPLVTLLSRVS